MELGSEEIQEGFFRVLLSIKAVVVLGDHSLAKRGVVVENEIARLLIREVSVLFFELGSLDEKSHSDNILFCCLNIDGRQNVDAYGSHDFLDGVELRLPYFFAAFHV